MKNYYQIKDIETFEKFNKFTKKGLYEKYVSNVNKHNNVVSYLDSLITLCNRLQICVLVLSAFIVLLFCAILLF